MNLIRTLSIHSYTTLFGIHSLANCSFQDRFEHSLILLTVSVRVALCRPRIPFDHELNHADGEIFIHITQKLRIVSPPLSV